MRSWPRSKGSTIRRTTGSRFTGLPGGYLSIMAAVGDRAAMEAIYEEAHPRKCLGLRDDLASLVPEDARMVVDLGGGTGDLGAAIARRLPDATITSIDASPFMVIAGRVQNQGVSNLRIEQGFAESTGIAGNSVDAATITLVFHECPNKVKRSILDEARRILRPGGSLLLADTPNDELGDYRGFYEPYKNEWLNFDPAAFLADAGFESIERCDVADRLWTMACRTGH